MALVDTTWYVKDGSAIGWSAVTPWAATTAVAAGTTRRQLATPTLNNERVFIAIVGGTTGAAEPSWIVTRGGKTTDNDITWQEVTGQPSVNGDSTNTKTSASSRSFGAVLGQVIKNDTHYFICSTAGTTGASEPTYNTTTGATTTDGTAVWTCIGAFGDFSAWANPHARLKNATTSTWGASGNTFYLSSNHLETQSVANWISVPGFGSVISVSDSVAPPTTYASGAAINTVAGLSYSGHSYTSGVNFNTGVGSSSAAQINIGSSGGMFKDCTINQQTTNGGVGASINPQMAGASHKADFVDCNFVFGNSGQEFLSGNFGGGFNMVGGSVAATGSVPTTMCEVAYSKPAYIRMTGVDLSNITGALFSTVLGWTGGYAILEKCKLASGVTIVSGALDNGVYVVLRDCDSAGTNYRLYQATNRGVLTQDTTYTKVGGASNGTTPISFKVSSNSTCSRSFEFRSEPIASAWNSVVGSSVTVSLDIMSNQTLTNADVWMTVEYSGDATSPLALIENTGLGNLMEAPVTIASSSSTWNGGLSGETKQTITATITPQLEGVMTVRLYVGKPSITVYVDPKIVVA